MKIIDKKATIERVVHLLSVYPLLTTQDREAIQQAIDQLPEDYQIYLNTYIDSERTDTETYINLAISHTMYYERRKTAFIEWAVHYKDGALLVMMDHDI